MTTFEGPPLDSTPGIGALTLGGFLRDVAAAHGPREALVFDDPLDDGRTHRRSYAELAGDAHRLARGLVAAGVSPGDTVGVVMGNRPETVAAIFAIGLSGAVAAPMSTFASRAELAAMIERTGASLVLTQPRLRRRELADEVTGIAREMAAAAGRAPRVVSIASAAWDELLAAGDGLAAGDRLDAAGLDAAGLDTRVGPDDPALVIFTSGTTSRPKAILHSHRAVCLQSWLQAAIFGRGAETRMYSALPLFWTAGLNTAMGATLAAGGCWVMHEVFDAGEALALMARERVTEPYTLPHQTAALAEHPAWAGTDLSALRCVYGKSAFARHPRVTGDPGWNMPVGYGLSETCAFVSGYASTTSRERMRIGAGPIVAGTRVRIVDSSDGRPAGVGETGEIAVAGPTLMLGYLDGAAPIDDDGFFHTGDLGCVDADGVLHFEGRTTEMIKTGGANVAPAEIEVQLRRLPEIKLSRIIGVPDARLGEAVVACVVLRDGSTLDADGVREFLRPLVAAYKVPRHVLVVDEADMPMTGTDAKVRDDALRTLAVARLASAAGPDRSNSATAGDR